MYTAVHISVQNKCHIALIIHRNQLDIMLLVISTDIRFLLGKAEYSYERTAAGFVLTVQPQLTIHYKCLTHPFIAVHYMNGVILHDSQTDLVILHRISR